MLLLGLDKIQGKDTWQCNSYTGQFKRLQDENRYVYRGFFYVLLFLCCTFYSELPYMGADLYQHKTKSTQLQDFSCCDLLWVTRITLCEFRWVPTFRRKKQPHSLGYHSLNSPSPTPHIPYSYKNNLVSGRLINIYY